jgi:hypothetical protein
MKNNCLTSLRAACGEAIQKKEMDCFASFAMTAKYKNNKFKIIVVMLVCLGFSIFSLPAQTVVKATIDSTNILIGEQTKIHLEIAADKNQQLQLPMIKDTLMTGVEVLGISKIDTADIGNNRSQFKYDYLITAFDSAVYLLPPFQVISGTDTAYSLQLALKVSTLPVDTVSKQFYDIKGVRTPQFVLMDYLPMILLILTILALLALAAFVIYRLINKKSLVSFKKDEPYVPPYIRALRRLDAIKLEKLWQAGKEKEYHSEITDTLRKYIEERFGVGAMEKTSGEILENVKNTGEANNGYDDLKQVLILADFVKFAKYKPLPDENELSMKNAYSFVDNTKPIEVAEEKKEKDETNEEKK